MNTPHNYDYDYFVIGAGSGGTRSARIAAGHGAKVGIAEGRHFGGTCVNIGCVPKKLFAYASDYGPAFDDAKGFGWEVEKPHFNWDTLIANKNKEINRLNNIYETMLEKSGVDVFKENAYFIDDHTLQLGDKQVTADKILIAVGGVPRTPSYEGAEHAIISDDAFYLKTLPNQVVIEGGGYIAVEFAHIFHGLGAKVTLIHRGNTLLRNFDSDISSFLTNELQKQGINLILGENITEIAKKDNDFTISTDKNTKIDCDLVFSAIGRVPNITNLGLKEANIATKDNGAIIVDDEFQTSTSHIYAVGDVINRVELTPVALAEGHYLADKFFNNTGRDVSYDNIATAVFSNPPIGTVGMTEAQARDKGHDIDIYKSDFKPMRHTMSGRDERAFMKLIVDKNTDIVLGAHMCGSDAPEIMQGIGIAVKMGATKADFDATIGIHPTSAEEFVTMRTPIEVS
jgi:glutathione reductase (NADPH)